MNLIKASSLFNKVSNDSPVPSGNFINEITIFARCNNNIINENNHNDIIKKFVKDQKHLSTTEKSNLTTTLEYFLDQFNNYNEM